MTTRQPRDHPARWRRWEDVLYDPPVRPSRTQSDDWIAAYLQRSASDWAQMENVENACLRRSIAVADQLLREHDRAMHHLIAERDTAWAMARNARALPIIDTRRSAAPQAPATPAPPNYLLLGILAGFAMSIIGLVSQAL